MPWYLKQFIVSYVPFSRSWHARIYTLRLFFEELISTLIGGVEGFFNNLLDTRFSSGVQYFFMNQTDTDAPCPVEQLSMPMSKSIGEDVHLDVMMVAQNFRRVWPLSVRDILLADFVEETVRHSLSYRVC